MINFKFNFKRFKGFNCTCMMGTAEKVKIIIISGRKENTDLRQCLAASLSYLHDVFTR